MYFSANAREIKLTRKVFDRITGEGISYAIVQLINASRGTSANSEGRFEITLPYGNNILISKCIGYDSDTLFIDSSGTYRNINIYLNPSSHVRKPPERIVNFTASEIIGKAITTNEKMFSKLSNYEFHAYIRCVIRENNDVGLGAGAIKVDPGIVKGSFNLIFNIWKTKPMKIEGIDEFISKGYYHLGEVNTFGTSSLGVSVNGIYSNGPVPLQMQYALPGNISAAGRIYFQDFRHWQNVRGPGINFNS
jgi:hypothetical protein